MVEGSLKELLGQRPVSRTAAEPPGDPADDIEYTAHSFGRVGARPLLMVCFIKSDGQHTVLPYADLRSIFSGEPDNGFTLEFTDRDIVVEGSHLGKAFRYLSTHRLAELVEADRCRCLGADHSAPVVSCVRIQRRRGAQQSG